MSGREGAEEEREDDLPLLSPFNVHELRAIESCLAQHLRVNVDQVDHEGFTVVPESAGSLRVAWQASASIAIDDFQSIVDEATAEHVSTGPQPRYGPPAPVPMVTRKVPRRHRAAEGGPT